MKRVLAPALCLAAAVCLIWPVASQAGWPFSHDYASPFERVETYRRAFAAFDLVPTWSPFCFNGHGTPSPLIYHRLFAAVGGAISLPLGSDLGTRVTLVLFAWLGAFGLFRLARRLSVRPSIALLGAVTFLWAPYSLTDWLIRGSVAEFASMMVLPWLLDALVAQLEGERVWLRLGLVLAAVLHAHQSLGLFLALLPVASTILALVRWRRWRVVIDAVFAASLAMLLTLPWLVPVFRVGGAFRLDTLKIFVPWTQYVVWQRYVVDDFPWGTTFQGFSVELSRFVIASLVIAVGLTVSVRTRVKHRWALALFVIAFAAATFLQFDGATPLYQRVPAAELLQFPWRLLGLLTPLACVMLVQLLEAVAHRGHHRLALLLILVPLGGHAFTVISAQRVAYPRYDAAGLKAKIEQLDGPWSAGEYLPKAIAASPAPTEWVQGVGCTPTRVSPAVPTHFRRLEVDVPAGAPCRLVFSQFDVPLLNVEGPGTRVEGSAFLTVDVPAAGGTVVVRPRALWELWAR